MYGQNIIELYLDTQGQLTIVAGQEWPKINLIKAFIVVLDTCKTDEDPSRNIRVLTTLLFSDIQGRLTPYTHAEFQTHPAFIAVLVTFKNEYDQIINEGARVITTLYIHFSNTQGQLNQ